MPRRNRRGPDTTTVAASERLGAIAELRRLEVRFPADSDVDRLVSREPTGRLESERLGEQHVVA